MAFAALEFITPTDISGTYDNTWRSYDCTAIIPSGMSASGVLIRYQYNGTTSANDVGFRRGDSTDTRQWKAYAQTTSTWEYAAIGLDSADDTFDYAINSGAGTPTVEVMGFFESSMVKFLQNGTAYTPGTGTYADVDISAATGGDTAVAGIFQIDSQRGGGVIQTGWRAKGSSDDIYGSTGSNAPLNGSGLALAKCDGSEVCQWKQSSSFGGASAILVGYFLSGISFNDPASDKSTGTTGSYQTVSVTSGAVAAYVEMIHTSGTYDVDHGLSNDGTADDTYGNAPPLVPAFIEVTSDLIEQKIENTAQDLYLRATIDAAASGGTTAALTGVSATASAGTLSATGAATAALTGVQAAMSAGALVGGAGALVSLLGVQATTGIGLVAAVGGATQILSGVAAAAGVGTLTPTAAAVVALTGVQAVPGVGTITTASGLIVNLAGLPVAVSAGTVTATGGAAAALVGVSATGQVGTIGVSVAGGQSIALTGVSTAVSLGDLTVTGSAAVALTGVQSNVAAGDLSAIIQITAALVGVSASCVVGVLDVTGGAAVSLTGVFADAGLGSLAVTVPPPPTSGDYVTRRAVIISATATNSPRVYVVEHDDRVYCVAVEDRVYAVEQELKTLH